MIVTTSWISENYNKFNNLYFGGILPNITFKVNCSRVSWGFASFRFDWNNDTIIPEQIIISNYYDSPEEVKIQTLLHEMIHIEDYFLHPEHFIRNHRRVSARTYDAHGEWFIKEAKRISKESGYKVTNHVTREEQAASKISKRVKNIQENKRNNALICAVIGTNAVFYFKTEVKYIDYLKKNLLRQYDWNHSIGEFKRIEFYKFNNAELASRRSCCSRVRGFRTSKSLFMDRMETFMATKISV